MPYLTSYVPPCGNLYLNLSAQWKPGYHGPACQGPQHSSENFAKDQALQAWRGSPSLAVLAESFFLGEGPLLERAPSQGLGEASSLAGVSSSPSVLCLLDRAHMGSASSAESQTRQRVVTPALSFPFSCIKQSTKQSQAKERQELPLW